MKIEASVVKNILVVRNDRFGEFLLNIPALRALKEKFVEAKITLVVDSYVRELAESIPFVDEVIEWGQGQHSLPEKFRFIRLIAKKNIDLAIMLNPSKELNIFTYLAGIPVRLGYARKWGFLLTHKMPDKKYIGDKHEIEYNLELVGLVGAKTQDKTLSLLIDDNLPEIEGRENLVAIHPWTSDPIKQWPKEYFAELIERLIRDLHAKVIIVGGKEELEESARLFKDCGSALIDLTGRTTLRQLAVLLKECKLLISGDSGPVHLGVCVGTPVLAIFRNDIPGKSAKRWGPRGDKDRVIEKNNLCDITVEEVLNKAKEMLS